MVKATTCGDVPAVITNSSAMIASTSRTEDSPNEGDFLNKHGLCQGKSRVEMVAEARETTVTEDIQAIIAKFRPPESDEDDEDVAKEEDSDSDDESVDGKKRREDGDEDEDEDDDRVDCRATGYY